MFKLDRKSLLGLDASLSKAFSDDERELERLRGVEARVTVRVVS